MESPVAIAKSAISFRSILGFAFVAIVVFAVLDVTGLTNWILFPVTTSKAKFFPPKAG